MPRRPLLITTLVLILSVSGLVGAEGEPSGNPGDLEPTSNAGEFSILAGSSITCSTAWPSATLGCWWERPVWVLGSFEVAIALDAQLALGGAYETYLAPMLSVAWYGQEASVWLEAALPDGLLPVPHVGRGDWVRVGFTYRWAP